MLNKSSGASSPSIEVLVRVATAKKMVREASGSWAEALPSIWSVMIENPGVVSHDDITEAGLARKVAEASSHANLLLDMEKFVRLSQVNPAKSKALQDLAKALDAYAPYAGNAGGMVTQLKSLVNRQADPSKATAPADGLTPQQRLKQQLDNKRVGPAKGPTPAPAQNKSPNFIQGPTPIPGAELKGVSGAPTAVPPGAPPPGVPGPNGVPVQVPSKGMPMPAVPANPAAYDPTQNPAYRAPKNGPGQNKNSPEQIQKIRSRINQLDEIIKNPKAGTSMVQVEDERKKLAQELDLMTTPKQPSKPKLDPERQKLVDELNLKYKAPQTAKSKAYNHKKATRG